MKLLKKLKKDNTRLLKFHHIPFLYYEYDENNQIKNVKLFPQKKHFENDIVFYLKVNIIQDYTFISLQHWIDIVHEANADFYIICDNKKLEEQILQKIHFYDLDIKFIKSCTDKSMKKLIKCISCTYWTKAAYAHLTTFYHASKHNIKKFWNIDADDTTILLSAKRAQELLKKAEQYAYDNNINISSLDMHLSKTTGNEKFWTMGITFLQYDGSFFDIFKNIKDSSWLEYFGFLKKGGGSADAFINYIGHNTKGLKINTFYNNNLYFMHWKYFYGFMFYTWQNGKLIFPFLKSLNVDSVSEFDIAKCCVDLNLDIKEDEWKTVMVEKVLNKNRLEEYIEHNKSLIIKEQA